MRREGSLMTPSSETPAITREYYHLFLFAIPSSSSDLINTFASSTTTTTNYYYYYYCYYYHCPLLPPNSSFMIVNGATKYGDMEHFRTQLATFKGDVCFEYLHERQLLALQV